MPDDELVDTGGDPFSLATDTDARLTLVFFGYTHCPDICQIVMSSLASAMTRLDDADRDDVEVRLRDDRPGPRRPSRRSATTSTGSTRRSWASPATSRRSPTSGGELGIAVEKGERLPSGGYEVTHGTQVIGIDADDQVPIVWTEGTSAAEFADDVHTLLTGEVA